MYGDKLDTPWGRAYSFPEAGRLAVLEPEDLAPLRSGYRAPYIIAAARAVDSGALDLEAVAELPCAEARSALKALPGVENASVSFMTQKMLLVADDARFDEILQQVVRTAKKIEPDFEIEL